MRRVHRGIRKNYKSPSIEEALGQGALLEIYFFANKPAEHDGFM